MGIIYGLLIFLEAIVSAMLIAVIFMQKTKGGMGGSAFGGGGGEAIFGSRMGNVLTKATVVLGSIFLVNTIILTIMTARMNDRGPGSVMEAAVPPPAPASSPMVPPQPLDVPAPSQGFEGGEPMTMQPVAQPMPEPMAGAADEMPFDEAGSQPEADAAP